MILCGHGLRVPIPADGASGESRSRRVGSGPASRVAASRPPVWAHRRLSSPPERSSLPQARPKARRRQWRSRVGQEARRPPTRSGSRRRGAWRASAEAPRASETKRHPERLPSLPRPPAPACASATRPPPCRLRGRRKTRPRRSPWPSLAFGPSDRRGRRSAPAPHPSGRPGALAPEAQREAAGSPRSRKGPHPRPGPALRWPAPTTGAVPCRSRWARCPLGRGEASAP
jgi:hypothetical protein